MQIIHINGHLVKDAEVKTSSVQGRVSEFMTFRVAVNEVVGTAESTTYYDVTGNKTNAFNYLKKGQKVSVIGKLRVRTYTDMNGIEKFQLTISTLSMELLGAVKKSESEPAPPVPYG